MKLLLYCVSGAQSVQDSITIKGVQGSDIRFVRTGKLAAVVSEFDSSQGAMDVQSLMIYHDVIDNCFKFGALIPFRFRTVLKDDDEVRRHLEERGTEYESKLEYLTGKTEMGVRLIVEKSPKESLNLEIVENDISSSENPGKSYLAKRKALYGVQESFDAKCESCIEALKMTLKGLFVDLKIEPSTKTATGAQEKETLISVYCLIQKDSVDRFRMAIEELKPSLDAKILMSGPWAPYNFV